VLDRVSSNSSIYYLSAISFQKDSGLYFLMDGGLSTIKPALKYLSDEGVGGKRSWGLGKFKFKVEEFKLKKGNKNYLTLSLTHLTDTSKVLYWKRL